MPILIEELLIEAEPPRAPPSGPSSGAPPPPPTGQADRLFELAIATDRHRRAETD